MAGRCFLVVMAFAAICVPAILAQDSEPDPKKAAREIDAILYSELTKDKMLEKLNPFVAVMDSKAEFKKKTGLDLKFGFGSGPGVMHYMLTDCGLQLVVDPDEKVRIIRRSKKTIQGKDYPEMSVSANSFNWKGYSRFYPD